MPDEEFDGLEIGGEVKKKVLPMFFLIDVSGSMGGERIAAVNAAMGLLVPELQVVKSSKKNRNMEIHLRAITFGQGGIKWKIGAADRGVPVEQYNWINFSTTDVGEGTPTAGAIDALRACVADDVYQRNLGETLSTPFMLLISDGDSNSQAEFQAAVDKLLQTKVGRSSVRVSLGIATENNPRATDELKYFCEYSKEDGSVGHNFKNSTDADLNLIPKLVVTATMRTIKGAGGAGGEESGGGAGGNVAVFGDDDDDIL
jgi:uncharacterized protein YegL